MDPFVFSPACDLAPDPEGLLELSSAVVRSFVLSKVVDLLGRWMWWRPGLCETGSHDDAR